MPFGEEIFRTISCIFGFNFNFHQWSIYSCNCFCPRPKILIYFHYFSSSRNDICQLAVGHLAIRERNFGLGIQWKWLWTVLRVFFSIIICPLKMLSFRYSNKRQLHFQNLHLSTPLSFISNRTAFIELRISYKIPQVYLQTEFPTSDWLNIFHFYEIVDEFQFTKKRKCF